jgi:hypothetical protein
MQPLSLADRLKLAHANKQPRIPLNTAVGDRWLSAWEVVQGVVWVQSRRPEFARTLAERQDGRLVATGVAGGYLRTFEFLHSIAWAKKLIKRYTAKFQQANPAKS